MYMVMSCLTYYPVFPIKVVIFLKIKLNVIKIHFNIYVISMNNQVSYTGSSEP